MASASDFEELRAIIEAQKETIEQLRQQLDATRIPGPEAKAADYILAVSPKAVAMKTFKTYAKGPVIKNGFFFQAVAYLRTVCSNGVDEQRRALDALVDYHGDGSTLELGSTELESSKVVVSFDTWQTVFAAAGFEPGPSEDYVPKHDISKIPDKASKGKSPAATESVAESS